MKEAVSRRVDVGIVFWTAFVQLCEFKGADHVVLPAQHHCILQ